MADPIIRLTFDGGDADQNAIDMRLLGVALQGADRITSDGLVLLVHGRAPKRGERPPLLVKVREPLAGSYDLPGFLQDAAWLLPLGSPIAADLLSGYLSHWWEAVKTYFSGRRDLAEIAMQAMVELNRDHLAARAKSEAEAHERQLAQLQMIRETLALQQKALEQFVAPVGRSVSTARLSAGTAPPLTVSIEEADQIRELGELAWSPLANIILRTDGFRFHTNALSIENPERGGFLMAKVSDPRFEKEENAYTAAAQRRSEIEVVARRGYKNDELVRIEIVDFVREIVA